MGNVIHMRPSSPGVVPLWAQAEMTSTRNERDDALDQLDTITREYEKALDAICDIKRSRRRLLVGVGIILVAVAAVLIVQNSMFETIAEQRDCLMRSTLSECGL